MVVAWQGIAVGAGDRDDGLREIFILQQACMHAGRSRLSQLQKIWVWLNNVYLESCSPQMSSGSRLYRERGEGWNGVHVCKLGICTHVWHTCILARGQSTCTSASCMAAPHIKNLYSFANTTQSKPQCIYKDLPCSNAICHIIQINPVAGSPSWSSGRCLQDAPSDHRYATAKKMNNLGDKLRKRSRICMQGSL